MKAGCEFVRRTEVSARVIERASSDPTAAPGGEGPNDGEGETPTRLGDAMPQKSDPSPSAQTAGAVKLQGPRLRVETPRLAVETSAREPAT